ncbi:MAG: hypothetical protein ACYCXR_07105 [Coriobacteriia bacterium]
MIRSMRFAVALTIAVFVGLGAAGCATKPDEGATPAASEDADPGGTALPDEAESAATDSEGVPLADPSLDLEDALGRTPADAFYEHMAAVGTGDPDAVWGTYGCSPPADFDTWAQEWEDAAEVYSGAGVLEERVISPGLALVRVVYRVTTGDDEIVVEVPGEWWRIEQVEGEWKVGWLPRQ